METKRSKKKAPKQSALPVSHATNAYELLADVRRAILEEPKRYYQDWWRITVDDRGPAFAQRAVTELPQCGTVCCVAGWVQTLSGRHVGLADIEVSAADILGVEEADGLFEAATVAGKPQTLAYAKRGAKRILDFMLSHEAQLKAKALAPSSPGART